MSLIFSVILCVKEIAEKTSIQKGKADMTSTFLGKWRISFQWAAEYDHYVIYRPAPRTMTITVLHTYKGSPLRETNIAFIQSADSKLYFQLNNGKYVKRQDAFFFFADTLAEAATFSFPGHEHTDPPASFKGKIQVDGIDKFMGPVTGWVLAVVGSSPNLSFFVTQITSSLASVQTKGNADGLDFSWVDLTGGTLNKVSLIGSDFSNCNLTNFKFLQCVMKKTILNQCIPTGADFSGSMLAGANLNQVDLTGVLANAPLPQFYTKPLQPPSPDNPRTTLERLLSEAIAPR